MAILQGVIFIEVDINTRDITFLRTDTVNDYDMNTTNIYMQAIYRNSDGDKTYLSSEDIKNYVFTLYTLKPGTNNPFTINGVVTTELKEQVRGGVVKFVIPKSCTNRAGVVKCELHVTKEAERIASTRFIFNVEKSLVTAFDEQLLEDKDFPVLEQLILEIKKAGNIDDTSISETTTYSSYKIDSQIKEKASKNEVRMKSTNITLNDCDSDMLKAIQGGQGTSFELLSVPRESSVDSINLTPQLKRALSLSDYSTIIFEQGSLSGSNGQENTSATRIRTNYLQFSNDINIKLYSGFKIRIFIYDENKNFLEVLASTGWIYNVDSYSLEGNPSYYYRIIAAYKSDANIDINTEAFEIEGLLNTNTIEIANLKNLISNSNSENPENYIAKSDNYVFDFKLQSDYSANSYCSDICIVKDKLFHFGVSDDDNINYVNSFVYDIDLDNKTGVYEATITHNLGHLNSVAYNDKMDALIFGNGGGSFDLKGKFFIYPNFYAKYKSGTTQFNISDCIEYDCTSLDIGSEYKFNAVWGDDNFNENNMVLLITNNHRTIHSIQLGKGTNDLGNGTLKSDAGTNEFNGTFKIQKTYTQETYNATGTDNTYCVQGAQYYGGHLYTGVGHEDVEWWDMTFNRSGIVRQEHVKPMCSGAGVKYTTNLGGLSVTYKYILLCVSNYVRVYLR